MKNKLIYFAWFLIFYGLSQSSFGIETTNNPSEEGSITVLYSPDLGNLTTNWVAAYGKSNPEINFVTAAFSGTSRFEMLKSGSTIAFVTKSYLKPADWETMWHLIVARDIVVPIMNKNNPLKEVVDEQGISSKHLAQIFQNDVKASWTNLLEGSKNYPIHYYTFRNESIDSKVAEFINVNPKDIRGLTVENAKELITRIQNDPYAIGFCRITDVYDSNGNCINNNITLLPIDKNSNGKMDSFEKIYDTPDAFLRGLWIGKYPHTLFTTIYCVSNEKPANSTDNAFVNWILTDGQKLLNAGGYSELISSERQSKLDKLIDNELISEASGNRFAVLKAILITVSLFVILGFLADILIFRRYRKLETVTESVNFQGILNENSLTIPAGLFFDKTHTWAFMETNGKVRIGMDEFLPSVTGTLTGIKFMEPGEMVKKGEVIVSLIQNGKQLNIKAPVSGIIQEQNQKLLSNASLINSSPYSDGWLYLIEPSNWLREIQFMLMNDKFRTWLKVEYSRLKDFLAIFLKSNDSGYVHPIFQDGGELKKGVMMELSPEVWEEFQLHYMDSIS